MPTVAKGAAGFFATAYLAEVAIFELPPVETGHLMNLRPIRVSLALAFGLAVIALLPVLAAPPVGHAPLWLQIVYLGADNVGTLLPFAAIGGGLVDLQDTEDRLLRPDYIVVAVVSYILAAIAAPLLEAVVVGYEGIWAARSLPFGPTTPGNLIEWREAVLATTAQTYTFDVEEPLRRPPNWIDYQLYLPFAFGAFCYLNLFVGAALAKLVHRPLDPLRRYVAWATALGWSVGYFVVVNMGREWVRAAPTHSAAVAAFLPLLLPLVLIGTHRLLSRRCTPAAGD